jgi:hypothetical protein
MEQGRDIFIFFSDGKFQHFIVSRIVHPAAQPQHRHFSKSAAAAAMPPPSPVSLTSTIASDPSAPSCCPAARGEVEKAARWRGRDLRQHQQQCNESGTG